MTGVAAWYARATPRCPTHRLLHAERLRDLHRFAFEVAVDEVDGSLHRALSPKPNSAYVLGADGTILFRAHWANYAKALRAALGAFAAGERPRRSQSGGVIRPTLRMLRNIAPALDRAGSGAWTDMWRVAPPLAAPRLQSSSPWSLAGPDAAPERAHRSALAGE